MILEIAPYAHVKDDAVVAFRKRRIRRLEGLLSELDYVPFRIVGGDRLEPRPTGVDPQASTDIREMDYLCVPQELSGHVASLVLPAATGDSGR